MLKPLKEQFREVDRIPTPWDERPASVDETVGRRLPGKAPVRSSAPHAPTGGQRRSTVLIGIAAALAIGTVVVLPIIGGTGVRTPAYAVTENADGTVIVEIRSIEDADGLERRLQEAGVPAAVYYLPPGKFCSPRAQDGGSPPIEDRQAELEHQRLTITQTEDGAFAFTVDRSRLLPGYTLLISTQYRAPEEGQAAVPSIDAEYTSGDVSHCEPIDGEVSG